MSKLPWHNHDFRVTDRVYQFGPVNECRKCGLEAFFIPTRGFCSDAYYDMAQQLRTVSIDRCQK